MAGNDMTVINSIDDYTIRTESDTTGPEVIGHFPSKDSDSNLKFYDWSRYPNTVIYENTVVLYMSEEIFASGTVSYITLTDCGTDKICENDDAVINYYLVSSLIADIPDDSFNRLYIDVTNITSFRRYALTVPAGAFTDADGGGNTGPAQAYTFEFEKLEKHTNFQHSRKAVPASPSSEMDGLVFGVSLYDMRGAKPDESPGTFTAAMGWIGAVLTHL